jgi:hypothetical protein
LTETNIQEPKSFITCRITYGLGIPEIATSYICSDLGLVGRRALKAQPKAVSH